ncbi:UNC-50 family protein [Blastocystis sp. ATCC 50177/Nand II]|uniref:UNC-50 family protein n=1 Tax=Blastocystis sp. subtype 1 (strain ATCC 50177 / NandII) TaxID=478820 RepID=A0A196SNL2_BLAHN|nr:UNC-50 family protein [Blastocystis sp. ATCC 50177/Nand II]
MMNLDITGDARKQNVFTTVYLKRFFSLRQMDLDYTFTQMLQICLSPSKVYKMTAWRKQTKNQWARDDPSFIVITYFFLIVICIAYCFAVRPLCASCVIQTVLQTVFYSLLAGLVIATITWYVSNHYMRIQRPHSPEQSVEWLYALDIHFNSFFPVLLILGVLQYIFLPFLVRTTWLPTLCADLLFAAAITAYSFITFMGYMYLPFIKTPFVILVVGGCVVCVVLCLMLFGVNITEWWIRQYFSRM